MSPLLVSEFPLGWLLYAGWLLLASIVTLAAYGLDKRAARAGKRRTPERTLHVLSLIGGFAGGWVGRHGFRHKTRKRSFAVALTTATLLHAALISLFVVVR